MIGFLFGLVGGALITYAILRELKLLPAAICLILLIGVLVYEFMRSTVPPPGWFFLNVIGFLFGLVGSALITYAILHRRKLLLAAICLILLVGVLAYEHVRPYEYLGNGVWKVRSSVPPPGWSILNAPHLYFSTQEIYLGPGETTTIQFELEVRGCAWVSMDNYLHIMRYTDENIYRRLLPLEGLEFAVHPKVIELRPDTNYSLELEIRASEEVPHGDYCFGAYVTIPAPDIREWTSYQWPSGTFVTSENGYILGYGPDGKLLAKIKEEPHEPIKEPSPEYTFGSGVYWIWIHIQA